MKKPLSREESLQRCDAVESAAALADLLEEINDPEDLVLGGSPVGRSYSAEQMIRELRSGTDVGRDYFKTVKHMVRTSIERDARLGPPPEP